MEGHDHDAVACGKEAEVGVVQFRRRCCHHSIRDSATSSSADAGSSAFNLFTYMVHRKLVVQLCLRLMRYLCNYVYCLMTPF